MQFLFCRHPPLSKLKFGPKDRYYLSTFPGDGNTAQNKVDDDGKGTESVTGLLASVTESSQLPKISGGDYVSHSNTYNPPLDEYATRKKLLMQYLQNQLWHQVDRIVDMIEREKLSQCNNNNNARPIDNLRSKVERQYRYKKRATRKFVASKNWQRLQKRKRRELQVVHESNPTGIQDDEVIVPTKFLGDATFDMLQDVSNQNIQKVDGSNDASIRSRDHDQSSGGNFVAGEKNRLLSLLDESEYPHDDGSKSRGEASDFAMKPRVMDTKVTLLDLLDEDYSHDEKDSETTKTNAASLLDLLDDRICSNDDDDDDSGKTSGSLLSLLDDMKDFESSNVKESLTEDAKIPFQSARGTVGTVQASNLKAQRDKIESMSLLELLNDDHYTDEPNMDDAQVARPWMEQNQTNTESLLDLLHDKNSIESNLGTEQLGISPKQSRSTKDPQSNDGHHLGDKPESVMTEVMNRGKGNNHKREATSLLDLLDGVSFDNDTSQVTKSHDISGTLSKKPLIDLLQENDIYSTTHQEPASSLDLSIAKESDKDILRMQNKVVSNPDLLDHSLEEGGQLPSFMSKLSQDKIKGDHEHETSKKFHTSLLDLLENDSKDSNEMDKSSDIVEMSEGTDFLKEQHGNYEEMEEMLIEDVEESFSTRDAFNKAQSLFSVMQRNDWDALYRRFKGSQQLQRPHENSAHEQNEEKVEEYGGEDDPMVSQFMDELLTGSSANKWILCADEFNILLLHVATSNDSDKIDKLLNIFLHMKELESSGRYSCGPNADTFAILLNFLEKFPSTSSIAYDIAKELIENFRVINDKLSTEIDNEQNKQKSIINEECLHSAMRILTKRLDIHRAEQLMNISLSEFGEGVRVSPNLFEMMLLLYKCENLQDKALDLTKKCIEENNTESQDLERFLYNASVWPKYKRDGSKIVLGSYLDRMADILDYMKSQEYFVSIRIWKRLLGLSAHVARTESESNWSTVHRCCRALISYEDFPKKFNERLLLLGLLASEKMRDPQLAADLICHSSTQTSSEHGMDSMRWPNVVTSNARVAISPKTYMKAIKLCIDSGFPAQGERILRHCYQINLPPKVLSDMYAMVLAGYVQNGDTKNVENLFYNVKSRSITPSEAMYAAYLHHLGANKKHEEVMSVLNSMLNRCNNDDVMPGISCFSSSILSAIKSRNYEDVLTLEKMMQEKGLEHNASTLQGVLIANARLGRSLDILDVIDTALRSKSPMDSSTFMLCLKYLIPEIMDKCGYDIEAIRTYLRSQVESNPDISHEAMELSKSLKNCVREDGRKSSKINSHGMDEKNRNLAWRSAVRDAVCLSKVLRRSP